jgi:hypothetical protein
MTTSNFLWDVTHPDTAGVSPNGQQIAHISRGASSQTGPRQ